MKTRIPSTEKVSPRGVWGVLKKSVSGFIDDKVPKLSAALAYYTVFSMAPLLILIISLASMFFAQEAVEGKIYEQLAGFMGGHAAGQLQETIKNASLSGKGPVAAVVGVIALVIGATTVFAEIQDSVNAIWGLKAKSKKGWLRLLKNRVLSFSVIISLGFILLVSLVITSLIDALNDRLIQRFPDIAVNFFYVLNQLITFLIITLIFGVVFKVLPDAKIRWRDILTGSCVTAVLFMIGKFAISFYISTSDVGSTYGAAGSLAILLVWTYYSAMILYFGAEFTLAFAVKYGSEIRPEDYAVSVQKIEVDKGDQSVQEKENEHNVR